MYKDTFAALQELLKTVLANDPTPDGLQSVFKVNSGVWEYEFKLEAIIFFSLLQLWFCFLSYLTLSPAAHWTLVELCRGPWEGESCNSHCPHASLLPGQPKREGMYINIDVFDTLRLRSLLISVPSFCCVPCCLEHGVFPQPWSSARSTVSTLLWPSPGRTARCNWLYIHPAVYTATLWRCCLWFSMKEQFWACRYGQIC